MPEEVLDDIIIANIGNEHEQNRVMPGEMPGQQEGVFANTSDGEDDNIDDGGPVRVIVPAPEQGHENEESGGEDEDSDDEDIVVISLTLGYGHDSDCSYISQCHYVSSGISWVDSGEHRQKSQIRQRMTTKRLEDFPWTMTMLIKKFIFAPLSYCNSKLRCIA